MNASLRVFADRTDLSVGQHAERWIVADVTVPVREAGAGAEAVPTICVVDPGVHRSLRRVVAFLADLNFSVAFPHVESFFATPDFEYVSSRHIKELLWCEQGVVYSGWLEAAARLRKTKQSRGHCVLFTDGAALRRMVTTDQAAKQAAALRREGVVTSIVNTGEDAPSLLERIAVAGGGFLTSWLEPLVQMELSRTVMPTVSNLRLEVLLPDGVVPAVLPEEELSLTPSGCAIEVGDLYFGQTRRIALRTRWPSDAGALDQTVELRLCADHDRRVQQLVFSPSQTEGPLNAETVVRLAPLLSDHARSEAGFLQMLGRPTAAAARLSQTLDYFFYSAPEFELLAPAVQQCCYELFADLHATNTEVARAPAATLAKQSVLTVRAFTTGERLHSAVQAAAAMLCEPGLPPLRVSVERLNQETALPPRLSVVDEMALLEQLPPPDGLVRVVFVDSFLPGKWFTRWNPRLQAAVVSFAGWEQLSTLPRTALAAHFLIKHAFRSKAPDFDPLTAMHLETRGCWGDFCMDRAEYELKLQTGEFCGECADALTGAGLDLDEILPLVERIREAAQPAAGNKLTLVNKENP